jgi:hypothetical protein
MKYDPTAQPFEMDEYYNIGDADGSGSLSYDEFVYLYNWILGGQGHT